MEEEKRILKKLIKGTDLYKEDANKRILKKCIGDGKFNIWVENGAVVLSQGYRGVIEHVGFNPNYIQGILNFSALIRTRRVWLLCSFMRHVKSLIQKLSNTPWTT